MAILALIVIGLAIYMLVGRKGRAFSMMQEEMMTTQKQEPKKMKKDLKEK